MSTFISHKYDVSPSTYNNNNEIGLHLLQYYMFVDWRMQATGCDLRTIMISWSSSKQPCFSTR